MQKIKLILIILLPIVFFACSDDDENPSSPEDSNYRTFRTELNKANKDMQDSMKAVTMTMDPDIDFAMMMIPHHRGAVRMADLELQYGNEQRAKDIATKTRQENLESIERLKKILAEHGVPEMVSDTMYAKEMDMNMMKMNETMNSVEESKDADVDFAEMMIHHQQGAIDMAQLELDYGNYPEAKEEAQKTIEDQQQEIIDLAKFLNER